MRGHTLAREIAMKIVYQADLRGEEALTGADELVHEAGCSRSLAVFARRLAEGWWGARDEVDRRISDACRNWALDRLTAVDRSILRIAAFELLHVPETPPKVVLNEAIELARKYGAESSPSFVNGVLDKILNTKAPEVTA